MAQRSKGSRVQGPPIAIESYSGTKPAEDMKVFACVAPRPRLLFPLWRAWPPPRKRAATRERWLRKRLRRSFSAAG